MPIRSRAGGLGLVAIVVMAGAVGAQSPGASPGISPLPVRVVEGTCERPGATLIELSEAIGTSPRPETQSSVHVSISEVPAISGPIVLVGGSEGAGLSRLVREACDALAAIPISASVESLNAGVAAGIALYEISRHRVGGLD